MLIIEHFERGAERFPERILVADDHRSFTYREMRDLSDRTATALIQAGIQPDDPVAILSPNHPLVLACQYGIIRAGGIWTPLNYRNTAADNAKLLATYEARLLFYHSTLSDQLGAILTASPSIVAAVQIDETPESAGLLGWLGGTDTAAFPARTMTDAVALLSTSGTTGEPKGAIQDHQSFETIVASYYAMLPTDEPPVSLVVAPLTHAAAIVHYAFLPRGGTNILLKSADPGEILAAIEKHRASILFLPPTVIYMLLSHPDLGKYDYSSLRYFLYGAAPMSVEKLKEAVAAFGPVMTQNYGQTEGLMMVTIMTPAQHSEILDNPSLAHRIASAGQAGPFARVAILDDEGKEVPRGTSGEICYQSELVMRGYFRNEAATAETTRDGWHRSSDVGYMDEDGFVYIVDRKRDMIISGGFNIFPGEVEQVALAHPSVQDCVIIGVPDEKWGEMVVAAVELKAGAHLDSEEFIGFCKTRLGSVKAPKRVEIWSELPRSTVGKTLRRVVRDKYWVGQTRQV